MSDETAKPEPTSPEEAPRGPAATSASRGSGGPDADDDRKKSTGFATESPEAEESRFLFRHLSEEPDDVTADDRLSAMVAQDIVDFDLGVVVLAHRPLTDRSRGAMVATRRTARSLSALPYWSAGRGPSAPLAWDLPLRRAIEAALEEDTGGERVFGCEFVAATADDLRSFGGEHRAARQELGRWLRAKGATLLVHVGLASGLARRRMASVCPEVVWSSWHSWLDDLREKTDLTTAELTAIFDAELGDLLETRDSRSDLREQILHRRLRAWFVSAPDGTTDEDEVRRVVRHAVAEARAGLDQGAAAQDRVRRMLGFDPAATTPATGAPHASAIEPVGEIERLLLVVWSLLERVDFGELMAVARALLPESEVPLVEMPAHLRDPWERGVHDDRRLRRDSRPRADWPTVFDARRATVLRAAGLGCVGDTKVIERGEFQKGDVRAVLGEWPEILDILVSRTRERDLLHRLPQVACLTLVQMLAAIRRQAPSLLTPVDFVRLGTGLTPAEGRMAVPHWVLDEQRDLRVRFLADHIGPDLIRRLGDATATVMAHRATETGLEALGEGVEDYEDALLLGAVDAFREFLAVLIGQGGEPGDFVDDCLDEIVARVVSPQHALMVISHLLMGGPVPSDARLGAATLRIVRRAVPDPERPIGNAEGQAFFEMFDHHLARTLNSVAASSTRSIDRWADAVAGAAGLAGSSAWQKAVASYMDDALARHDIPWGNRNRRPLGAPIVRPLFAPQFLGPREDDPSRIGPDLAERLFARSAEDHLIRLGDFARQGNDTFFASMEHRLVDLLSETYWVLSDEIDRDEIDARNDVNLRLSSEIWGGITDGLGLAPVRDARGAAALVMARLEAPRGSPDRLPLRLLDLFAPTVLLHWRLRMFPAGPLSAEESRHFLARLERLKAAAGTRRADLELAFRALARAEDRLVELFAANECPRTAGRHRDRAARIRSLAEFFSLAGLPAAHPPE